ncbi:MAG: DUF177 domain-containing protein [Cytophagales bacterium]|nr:DUF177 domain-containing protein [Cytophagales bacterium]
MRDFAVNIIGLSNKAHHFNYRLEKGFFELYGTEAISDGRFEVSVILDKKETFIEVEFKISGLAALVCDRTLEPFDFPIQETRKVVFKYGDEPQELSDEIVIIARDEASIDLGQYLYEYIALAIPMKKLHPRFATETDSDTGLIYSTATNNEEKDEVEPIDPRWEKLKNLNKN